MSDPGTIVRFYRNQITDDRGRLLREIQTWSDSSLEAVHDYIQWMFPLRERSGVNPRAPLLDASTIAAFQTDSELRDQLHASFLRMLRFYGAQFDSGRVTSGANFAVRSDVWLSPGNHNHLRITRILKCLNTLGLTDDAAAFLEWLMRVHETHPERISESNVHFWRNAVA
jgi:hypothetical protein